KTIETAYKLYEHTGNRNYLYLAFEYAERSKAAVFLSSIRDLEAKHFSGIPDSLLVQEENIKQEISFYKDQIFQLKQSGRPDSNRLKLWTNILLKKTQEQEDLTHYFEKNYPRYYSFKYNSKVTGVNEIQQKLKIKDVLVEYVVNKKKPSEGKSELYCFTISKDNFQVTKSNADQNYDHAVKIVQHFLINSNAGATKKKDYQNYSLSAYHLYNKLLAPFQKTLKDKNLIVVPDDQLAYIPFDALISQMPDTTKMDFRKLHYLIKDYPISYSYSATLLFDREKKGRAAKNSVLAFAPNYSIKEKNFRQPTLWSHLLPLAGAAAEANNISKIFRADIFSGKQASEYNFKKIAPDYDILHLAMHTMVNDSMPMFSKLIFTASKNQDKDDNILSTQEIYNMKFNARLAVLSACNTGSGKLQKGEGVMSMARGFLFAGCPGIVMTLWEVDDKSSADLMGNFYEFIKKGKSKDEALRMAKLKHLEESDALMAHPYFWQSYVIIGDTEPLYAGKEVYLFTIGLFLIASWILYDLIKIRKRKKASGKNLRP
ncbi:MAG: CHAT domain-containing protein, partial [Bacteroidota bacterium]|nr:CHAT domain-containing protein [Bacteroidota bacterium]